MRLSGRVAYLVHRRPWVQSTVVQKEKREIKNMRLVGLGLVPLQRHGVENKAWVGNN
jgi:hypothetical protein